MVGLLDAICNAAEWDEQISEGKSLSEREEAVLQALELLTRSAGEVVWVKGTDLREKDSQSAGSVCRRDGECSVDWAYPETAATDRQFAA